MNNNSNHLAKEESFSSRIKNALIGSNGGGCIPASALNTHSTAVNDDLYSIIADVPFFPPEHKEKEHIMHQQQIQQMASYREEELVVDFPSRQTQTHRADVDVVQSHTLSIQTNPTQQPDSNTQNQSPHNSLEEQTQTFPGFALYTMAKVHYVLGQYTKALDTTTECLAFQRKALLIHANNNMNPANNSGHNNSPSGFGSVRNLLKGNSVHGTPTNSPLVPNAHHPIVIANSTQKLLSHYPTHACVAQTLLLRAQVLAACGLYGEKDEDAPSRDETLVHQAIQHVEMAVAIQRKISTFTNVNVDLTQWELATPMILLGVLKVEIQSFEEANDVYEEALLILRSVRQLHDAEQTSATERGDVDLTRQHAKISKRITKEMANVFYLKGRSFQCRRMYSDAFDCYNIGLGLFKSAGVPRHGVGIRRIIRCMKKSSALLHLLSHYWDDANII